METLHALIDTQIEIVINTALWESGVPIYFGENLIFIEVPEGVGVQVGWSYKNGVFSPPIIPETPLPILAEQKRLEFWALCADEITRSNFQSDALGSIHNYDNRIVDQLNLKLRYDISLATGISQPLWASDGTRFQWKDHSSEEMLSVMISMNNHIKALQTKLVTKLAAVDAAVNKAQIDAIIW